MRFTKLFCFWFALLVSTYALQVVLFLTSVNVINSTTISPLPNAASQPDAANSFSWVGAILGTIDILKAKLSCWATFGKHCKEPPRYLIQTDTCNIIEWPAFSLDVMKLFKKYKSKQYICPNPNLADYIQRVNYTSVTIPLGLKNCTAIELVKSITFTKYDKVWLQKVRSRVVEFPEAENVLISCRNYEKIVPLVPMKNPRKWPEVERPKVKNPHPANVLILGIDSLSRLNFLRQMNQTRHFLESHHFQPFFGHHKVGDNTRPNIFAMMLGLIQPEYTKLLPKSGKLDSFPFIMKEYSNEGYLTSFIEDFMPYGLFHHEVKGFTGPYPVDYFPRAVNLYIEEYLRKKHNRFCYGDQLEMELYYDLLIDQMSAFRLRNQSYLIWTHISKFTHDNFTDVQYVDLPNFQLLSQIFEAGHQNDTVIILYSDHANRIDKTWQILKSAYHENRTPLLYVYVPEGLKLKNEVGEWISGRKIREIMELNAHQLTSHLDIYATLKHLLYGVPVPHPHSVSLFTDISSDRTCDQAGVPIEYCLCNALVPYDNQEISTLFGKAIIAEMNHRLKPFLSLCVKLELDQVVNAMQYPNISSNANSLTLFLVFTVKPSGGIFETVVQATVKDGAASDFVVALNIDRKDRCGEQIFCVAEGTEFETYCYCRELLATTCCVGEVASGQWWHH